MPLPGASWPTKRGLGGSGWGLLDAGEAMLPPYDGVSDAGEVRPLAAHGIVALSCHYVAGDGVRVAALSPNGARLADGRTRPTYDVILNHAATTLTRR